MTTIRRIQVGEHLLYRDIRLRALKEDPNAYSASYESAIERTEERWRDQADGSAQGTEQAIFIVFDNDVPIGLSAVYRDKKSKNEAEVFQVWVRSDHRNKGIGVLIMDTVLEWSGQNGYEEIIATVSRTNRKALGFYLKYGFTERTESDGEVALTMKTRSSQSVVTTPNAGHPAS